VTGHFTLAGDIDAASAPELHRELLAYLAHANGEAVIECSGVEFIDSHGLRMLVQVQTDGGRRLVLRDVPPFVHRLFEITGLTDVFKTSSSAPPLVDGLK
jgi:anti-sigma B factor antagonist